MFFFLLYVTFVHPLEGKKAFLFAGSDFLTVVCVSLAPVMALGITTAV